MGERSGAPSGFSPASIVISKPPVAVHLPQPDVSDNRDAPHRGPYPATRAETISCSKRKRSASYRSGRLRRGMGSTARMALGGPRGQASGRNGSVRVRLLSFPADPSFPVPFLWANSATPPTRRWGKAPVTGTSASSVGAASPLDLRSFPQAGVAFVFGASGGIGGALLAAIRAEQSFDHVVAFSRSTSPSIDLLDEASLERAASFAAEKGELHLVIDATGFLHDERQGPEKSWRQLDAAKLARSFALNAIGPALIMKHVLPRLPRSGKAVFATLSARV